MRNHKQDAFDGGRAASLTTQETANEAGDARGKWLAAGASEDLALALAMLALAEGSELGGN